MSLFKSTLLACLAILLGLTGCSAIIGPTEQAGLSNYVGNYREVDPNNIFAYITLSLNSQGQYSLTNSSSVHSDGYYYVDTTGRFFTVGRLANAPLWTGNQYNAWVKTLQPSRSVGYFQNFLYTNRFPSSEITTLTWVRTH